MARGCHALGMQRAFAITSARRSRSKENAKSYFIYIIASIVRVEL